MDLMQVLQDADAASFEVEKRREEMESAKVLWEIAKERFETAKTEFDQALSRADEVGIPRGKLRKLVEERTGSLLASGLMPTSTESRSTMPKVPKAKKAKAKPEVSEAEVNETVPESFDEESEDAILV